MSPQSIGDLVTSQRPGHALQRGFYQSQEVFDREIERIFLKSWHYACHVSQIPEAGDWYLFELAGESVIIVRSTEGGIKGLINVCRHRGSRICLEPSGRRKLFVCPYHGWTYDLDGGLRVAKYMPDGFDPNDHGLKTAHLRELHGMIFINLDPDPVPFDPIEEDLGERLRPYRLADAKVAAMRDYPISANWKLAVETTRSATTAASRTPSTPGRTAWRYRSGRPPSSAKRQTPDLQPSGFRPTTSVTRSSSTDRWVWIPSTSGIRCSRATTPAARTANLWPRCSAT